MTRFSSLLLLYLMRSEPSLNEHREVKYCWTEYIHINIWMQNSLWPVCVWAHSSWHSLGSRTPSQSLLFCHHQTESWSQKRTQRQGWSCTFWQVSPWFRSWALSPCRGAEHRQPAEKTEMFENGKLDHGTIHYFNRGNLPFASSEASDLSWTCGSWLSLCHSENVRLDNYCLFKLLVLWWRYGTSLSPQPRHLATLKLQLLHTRSLLTTNNWSSLWYCAVITLL